MKSDFQWGVDRQDTINAVLLRAVEKDGDREFLDFAGKKFTVADINSNACRVANGLREMGVSKGQTVATILDNSEDAIYVWLGINKLGAVSVPINTALKGEFLRHQLGDSDAEIVIAESDYCDRIISIETAVPSVKSMICRGGTPTGTFRGSLSTYEELLVSDNSEPNVDVGPSDLAMLIYTGGTTGPSKGCMVGHNYACNLANQIAEGTGRDENTVSWTALPLFHFNAVSNILCELIHGGRVALYPRFSVSNFWPEVERTGANTCTLLGSMFPMLLGAEENEAEKRCAAKMVTVSGAPFPAKVQKMWKDRFGAKYTLSPGFGLTECSLVTSVPIGVDVPDNSSGRLNDDFDVRAVDDDGREVPVGESGEIIVRPKRPNVMFKGYWKRPEDTLKVYRDMWFLTGDIGKFDENGFFFFVDRKKDYLRRRGENISSFEVETAFRQHPAIADVAAHAVLSDMSEDELKVTIILKEGQSVTEEDLCRWAADRMPYYAVPRYIEYRTTVPRSAVGRILKYELRDEGVTPNTWDREAVGFTLEKR